MRDRTRKKWKLHCEEDMQPGDHSHDTGYPSAGFRPKPLMIFIIIIIYLNEEIHCLHNDTGTRPFSDAKGSCQSHVTRPCRMLTVPPSEWQWTLEGISSFEPIWLALERKRFSTWEWLDKSPYADKNLNVPLGNSVYGQLDLRNERIISAPASRTPAGMICEHKDCSGCGALANMAINCVHVGSSCYVFRCGVRNWYSARVTCAQHGSDLAIIKDHTLLKRLAQQGPTSGDDCKFFWLGLRREKWTFGNTEKGNAEFLNWGPEQPGELGDCAVMVKGEFDIEVKAANCTDSYHFLCQDDKTEKLYANRNCEQDAQSASQIDNSSKDTLVLLGFFGCLSCVFLMALVTITIYYCKKRDKRRKHRYEAASPQEPNT